MKEESCEGHSTNNMRCTAGKSKSNSDRDDKSRTKSDVVFIYVNILIHGSKIGFPVQSLSRAKLGPRERGRDSQTSATSAMYP